VAGFARVNLIKNVQNVEYQAFLNGEAQHLDGSANNGAWFKTWEDSGLLAWNDRNGDGKIQYASGAAFAGRPAFTGERGEFGQRLTSNPASAHNASMEEMRASGKIVNELYFDNDIIVLANPEIAGLPNWVIAFIAAGGLAAALSTAAGLLLVISTSISHDLLGKVLMKDKATGRSKMSEKAELMSARLAAVVAIIVAGYLGINPPGFVAQVVALAFGLAAASFFPTIVMGIFYKRMNKEGAIAGMVTGLGFTFAYVVYFVFMGGDPAHYLWGIAPTGIGTVGMVLHFIVAYVVSQMTPPPPSHIQELVESIRIPRGAGAASDH
jgi:cation/acetate symporter